MSAEPFHRSWLHALEDEATAPGTVMQIARIVADYAARSGSTAAVPWTALIRQTHRSRTAISGATSWLVDHGWLVPRPHKTGQRVVYDLAIGHPETGTASRPVRPDDQSGQQTANGARNHDGATKSGTASRPVRPDDQSGQRTQTGTASGPEPVRPADYLRPRLTTSLSPAGLHAALAAVVPGVTERESDAVRQLIGRRPGVRSAAAVMRAEIEAGYGPDLVAQVRGVPRTVESAPPSWHPYEQTPAGICKCGHVATATVHRPRHQPDS